MLLKKELTAFQRHGLDEVIREQAKKPVEPGPWPERPIVGFLTLACMAVFLVSFPQYFDVPDWLHHLIYGFLGVACIYQTLFAFGWFSMSRLPSLPAAILYQPHRLGRASGNAREMNRTVFFICIEIVTISLMFITDRHVAGFALFVTFIWYVHSESIVNYQCLKKLENRGYRELVCHGQRQFLVGCHQGITSVTPTDIDGMGIYSDDMVCITNPDNGRQIHRHIQVRDGSDGYCYLSTVDFMELQLQPTQGETVLVLMEPI